MKTRISRRMAITALAFSAAASAAAAPAFPTKPIRIIVTSAPGGAIDAVTRLVAQRIRDDLGQTVIVENHVGAGGVVAIREVKAAPADGYTLLAVVNTIAIQQAMRLDPGYDLAKDFKGIGPMTRSPFLLLVSPEQPDKSLADLLTRAKANPGKVDYASAGIGSTTHFVPASLAQRAGVEMNHIPYKGNSAAWPDLIAGRVGMLFEPYSTGSSMIKSGKLKALAVTSTKRLDVLPDVPTIAEQGVNYNFYLWMGLLAPAGTPKEIVQRLSGALQGAMKSAELTERFRNDGSEPMLMSPDEFDGFLKSEVAAMTKLVADLRVPKE